MIRYALCYCIYDDQTVFVEKIKPDWQRGKLNLPGGKVEEGEEPADAAIRELKEETNLDYSRGTMTEVGKIIGNGCEVHIFFGYGRGELKQLTEEKIHLFRHVPVWNKAEMSRFIANLQLIIPLVKASVTGWNLTDLGTGNYTFAFSEAA